MRSLFFGFGIGIVLLFSFSYADIEKRLVLLWIQSLIPDEIENFYVYRDNGMILPEMSDQEKSDANGAVLYFTGYINDKPYCFPLRQVDLLHIPYKTPTSVKELTPKLNNNWDRSLQKFEVQQCLAGVYAAMGKWHVAKWLNYDDRPVYFVPAVDESLEDGKSTTIYVWEDRKKVGRVKALDTICQPPAIRKTITSNWMPIHPASITEEMRANVEKHDQYRNFYGKFVASCARYG